MLTHTGTNTIETERLILRRFKYTDDDAMLKYWIADEKIQSLYSEPVYTTKDEVKGLLDKYIGSYERNDYYRWAVIEKNSDECIGQIAYFLVDSKNHFAEIEYCIGADFQCCLEQFELGVGTFQFFLPNGFKKKFVETAGTFLLFHRSRQGLLRGRGGGGSRTRGTTSHPQCCHKAKEERKETGEHGVCQK